MTYRIWAVFTVLGAGIGAATTALILNYTSINSGHFFAFTGAVIGTGIAVVGAVLTEDYRTWNESRRALRRLANSVRKFREARFYGLVSTQGMPQQPIEQLAWRVMTLRRALEGFGYALEPDPIL
ncbi:MAG: hypothetical protein KDE32_14090, partial [Novosphingobium sp.]|nr:hypothetical protein [Novosphingobium sp.]